MLREEIGKWFKRLFLKGARPDVDKELLSPDHYLDARHMRINSVEGAGGALESMGGEQVLWNVPAGEELVAAGYECVGSAEASGDETAFWCHENGVVDPDGFPPIITVNGVVMAKSPRIPYRFDRKMQLGEVSRCAYGSGVLFPADAASPAMFWDIKDMRSSLAAGSQKYFTAFDPLSVSVLPAGPRDWFEFEGFQQTGIGLPVGTYVYWPRFVTPQGDRTNPGPPSAMVRVPSVIPPMYDVAGPGSQFLDGQYPGGQSVGAPANQDAPTQWAPRLRILVDNPLGFTELEIVRQRFNNNEGINGAGIVEVIARIPIGSLLFGYVPFTDPVDSNFYELIPPDVAAQQNLSFTAPTTVEHTDNRLIYGGVTFEQRAPVIQWRQVNGLTAVPITNRVFTYYDNGDIQYESGHSDPVSATYMQGAMHNERYGLGAMLWDGYAGTSFVSSIVADMQFPDRRDAKKADSLALSYNRNAIYGTPADPIYAANNNCQNIPNRVSPTFDAIVQGKKRKYNDSYTNVVNSYLGAPLDYNPPRPSSPTDPNWVRYRQKSVEQWEVSPGTYDWDTGYLYNPQKHVLGAAVYGPSDIDTAAPWWEIMDIMATPPAGRVVAEGIACYDLNGPRSKASNALRCHFPDIESFVVEQAIADDIIANPSRYRLKLVPFGYGQEVFSKSGVLSPTGADILNNMDVQYDDGVAPYSVNVGTTPGSQGVQPGAQAPLSPTNYVGYSAFRTTPLPSTAPENSDPSNPQYSVFMDPNNPAGGSKLFIIDDAQIIEEGRGSYMRIRTTENIYRLEGISIPSSEDQFWTQDAKEFHEPFYVVQIIRDGATVPQLNIQNYRSTGYRVARERTIALASDPASEWTEELFHARVEDCVIMPGSTQMRYVWVREPNQPDKRWLCFTNAIGVDFTAAIAAFSAGQSFIDPEGNEVWGAYSYSADLSGRFVKHRLTFNQYGSSVPQGARVIVKYDDRSPIQVFNIDGCTVGQDIFCPLDRVFSADIEGVPSNTAYPFPPPLPYRSGVIASNWKIPYYPTTADIIEPPQFGTGGGGITSIRQWAVQGHVTTRTPLHLAVGKRYSETVYRWRFPAMHYVMRPVYVDASAGAGFNPQYDIDFPGESSYFRQGGIWAWTDYNNDYSKKPLITGKGYPLNGVLPSTDGCNAILASLRRIPGQTDTPGLRTFTPDNAFYISEETGGIQHICALDQGGMQQLFVWSEEGCCRIPYNKNILVGADGGVIGTQSVSNFWPREEQWITRGHAGMPQKSWRLSATVTAPGDNATFSSKMWVNRSGAYMLVGAQVRNILVGRYASKLLPLLRTGAFDQRKGISSVFNRRNGEWWITMMEDVQGRDAYRSFVYSAVSGEWVGQHGFEYENMLQIGSRVVGYRRLTANELMEGQSFIGPDGQPEPIERWAETVFCPFPYLQSEAVKWRVGPDKPDEMRVYDREGNLMLIANEQLQEAIEPGTGQWWVLNIDNWEQMMGNVAASYDPNREQPPQSTAFIIRWYFRRQEQQRLSFAMLQARAIT